MREEREIHPSHDTELDGSEIFPEAKSCRKCMFFVTFNNAVVTPKGAAECKPVKISLR